MSDIQDLTFPTEWEDSLRGGFDAVFSNATLHWCKRDPAGVLQSAKSVLKPGGRFAAELGGFMNVVGVRSALHQVLRRRGYDPIELDPWYFPTADEYKKVSPSFLHPYYPQGSLYTFSSWRTQDLRSRK